ERARVLYEGPGKVVAPWENLKRPEQQVLTEILARRLAAPDEAAEVKPGDVEDWFGVSDRTARAWLAEWAKRGLVEPITAGAGQRIRRYRLAPIWRDLVDRAVVRPKDSGS